MTVGNGIKTKAATLCGYCGALYCSETLSDFLQGAPAHWQPLPPEEAPPELRRLAHLVTDTVQRARTRVSY